MVQARIPRRFFACRFETYFPQTPSQTIALERSQEFALQYPNVNQGLYFFGPTGVGKTHLGVAILKTLLQRKIPVLFVDCNELFFHLKRAYDPDSLESELGILRPVMETEIILFDDIGAHRTRDWVYEIYQTIINYRYKENLMTLATTNLDPTAHPYEYLPQALSQRVFSRLFEMCQFIEIEGKDQRIVQIADKLAPPSLKETNSTGRRRERIQHAIDYPESDPKD